MKEYTDEQIFAEAAKRRNQQSESTLIQAVQFLANGMSTKQAATQMKISHRTVESYVEKLCISYGAVSRTHLVAILFRDGKLK